MPGIAVTENYVGCKIFIHDADGNDIATTTVTGQYKELMTVIVPGRYANALENKFVTVLILTPDSVHEFGGKIQNSVLDSTSSEIALFKGQIRKDCRHALRYPVQAIATVQHLVIDNNLERMLHTIQITIVNLSTSGVLISALPNTFAMHSIFEMVFEVSGQSTTMYGKVVRQRDVTPLLVEYGCRFVLPNFTEQ